MNFAFSVEIKLLVMSFTVSRSAVSVPQSSGWFIRSPSIVKRVWFGSTLPGRWPTTIRPYVTSFFLSPGTSSLLMNEIVSVPSTWPGIPWSSLPISFPYELTQTSLYLGLCIKCQYSSNLPVCPSIIAPANSHNNFIENLRDFNDSADNGDPFLVPMSMHDNIISCVKILVFLF